MNAATGLTYNGGTGTDTLTIGAGVDLSGSTIALTSVEQIELVGGGTGTMAASDVSGKTFIIAENGTGTATFAVNVDQATVDLSNFGFASSFVSGTDGITLNGSALGIAGTLTGSAADDTIQGGSAGDTIVAGEGIDSIDGNAGNDSIDLTETTSAADTVIIASAVGGNDDSSRVQVVGNDNDTGGDTITGFAFGTDIIQANATAVIGFVHATDTAIGTATGAVDDGTAGSFLTSVGLIEFNQATNNDWDDNGDVAISFASPSATMTETNFEAALQYNITGTTAANTITTGGLNDVVSGGNGIDTISTGAGNDFLQGSIAGDSSDADVMIGGAGNDTYHFVTASAADNLITETSGTDTIFVTGDISLANLEVGADDSGAAGTDLVGASAPVQIEQIVINAGDTATFASTQLTGNTMAINADAAGTTTLNVTVGSGVTSTLANLTFASINYQDSTGTSVAGIAFDANDIITHTGGAGVQTITTAGTVKNTVIGGAGDDIITLGTGLDTVQIATNGTRNGADTVNSITFGAGKDIIDIAFGDGRVITDLRGTGAVASVLGDGGTLATNTGLVISTADDADEAAVELFAEALVGEASGDIIYLLTSTDYDAAATVSLYEITYAAAGNSAEVLLATFASTTLNTFHEDNLADYSALA
jgi:hypothetical protein